MTTMMIKTDNLYAHPDNPRKSLGNLTELVESIKVNGILQNLTVVPWFSSITRAPADDKSMDGCYRVVIGHRRLEAAKQAGLEEVPCNIVEMSPKEQMTTMLMENMQREELTPYEQAQGFQMMMDLGITKSEIQERTGFSRSTVDHRLHLLELDQKALDAVGDQIRMSDLIRLEKIKDAEVKNEILKEHGGKDTFESAYKRAIEKQDTEERKEKIRDAIKGSEYDISFKTYIEEDWSGEDRTRYVGSLSFYSSEKYTPHSVDKYLRDNGVELDEEVTVEEKYDAFYFYAPMEEMEDAGSTDDEQTEKQQEREKRKKRYIERSDKLKSHTNAANEKRKAWIREFIAKGTPVDYGAMIKYMDALTMERADMFYVNYDDMEAIIIENYMSCLKDWEEDEDDFRRQHGGRSLGEFVRNQMQQAAPGYVVLAKFAAKELSFTKGTKDTFYIACVPRKDPIAAAGYKMLQELGYVVADWERGLLEGTLEEFVQPEQG